MLILLWGVKGSTGVEARGFGAAAGGSGQGSGGVMAVIDGVKRVLQETLQLGDRISTFNASTPLFGSIPEFDSMAVVTVITGLEEQFDIEVEDEDVSAEVFETLGSLTRFVGEKLAA
jgi:acyl carrier protein